MSNGTQKIFSRDDCWTSIEKMPYWNWDKILETGDLKYIFQTREYPEIEIDISDIQGLSEEDKNKEIESRKEAEIRKVSRELSEIWIDLQQQHMDEFGTEQSLINRMRRVKKLILLKAKFILTGRRYLLNLILIEEKKLEEGRVNHIKMYATLDKITSHKGFDIDPEKFTVIKWYYALKDMIPKNG